MPEPVYTPVLPREPLRLSAARLRPYWDAGGFEGLRLAVWDALTEALAPRASCPAEVAALRAWRALEHPREVERFAARFAREDEDLG